MVAAYKGGSKDIPSSSSRVEEYSKTLQKKYGVKMYGSIEEMCRNVDAVLLESVDGRPHLEQFKAVLRAEPVNASQRNGYRDYYDDELRDLVGEKARRIVKLYGYEF